MPRNSHREPASLLIAAVSGRALAACARRAGFIPLVADFFADADTQELAHACRKLNGIKRGMHWEALRRALDRLAKQAPSPVLGLVYGAGFEDRPELLSRIAKRWPVLGNDADTVERIKSPERFFPMLDRLNIAHPQTVMSHPAGDGKWLAKRRGGAGGSHIASFAPDRCEKTHIGSSRDVTETAEMSNPRCYFQEVVPGRPISALFVGNGADAQVLSFSEQWTAPTPREPWRYGGAVRPAALSAAAKGKMTEAVERLTGAFHIKGLASADFLLGETGPLLLEINPRPGATLDIFDSGATPLLKLHLDAVLAGELPRAGLRFDRAKASAIAYAPEALTIPPSMVWPAWAADRPKPGDRIDKSRPICTVLARAATGPRARRLVEQRIFNILNALHNLTKGKRIGQGREAKGDRVVPDGLAERQYQGRAAR